MLELISRRLREVTVRPAVGADERIRWDALMGAHHYLPFRGLVGRSVRHVAVLGEHWLALVGWHAGAFKLRARDRWIGWLPEQQFRRLHLIANNARFLILPECAAANLASRVLGLSLRKAENHRGLAGSVRAFPNGVSSLQIVGIAYRPDPKRRDDRSQIVPFVRLPRRASHDSASTVLGRLDRRRAHVAVRRSDGNPNDAFRVAEPRGDDRIAAPAHRLRVALRLLLRKPLAAAGRVPHQ